MNGPYQLAHTGKVEFNEVTSESDEALANRAGCCRKGPAVQTESWGLESKMKGRQCLGGSCLLTYKTLN